MGKQITVSADVVKAIKSFLELGHETRQIGHGGYYSEGGWPYEILSDFVKQVENNSAGVKP